MAAFVGYYRVSTSGQGRSGLGLDAQRDAVRKYVAGVGGELVKEFREVESGANSLRPELNAAIRHCKTHRAMLVIAKIDRLARNVHFIAKLLESGVEFIAADMPHANKLTIHIIAAMAEHERDITSQRTKAALKAAKDRGQELGNPQAAKASPLGVAKNKEKADAFALRMKPALESLIKNGFNSYSRLAAALEASGTRTQRGGTWTAAGVKNILQRLRMDPTG